MANKKNKKEISIHSSAAEYLTFIASSGEEGVELRYQDENIWLTQRLMAVLYDVDISTINQHIKKILDDNELQESSTIGKFPIVQTEGTRQVERDVLHYNLQMIIAVGFKVAAKNLQAIITIISASVKTVLFGSNKYPATAAHHILHR